MKPKTLVFLGVKVPPEIFARLQRAARDDDRTTSAYVRRLLQRALDSEVPDGAGRT